MEKVEAATAKLDASFVDYRPETGTWVFVVEHFTKYGIHEFLEDENAKKQKRSLINMDTSKSKELQEIDEEKMVIFKKLNEQQAKVAAYGHEKEKVATESMQDQDSDIDDLEQQTFPVREYRHVDIERRVATHYSGVPRGIDGSSFFRC
ncbi:hypothetical protein QZH41_000240 [Actinostola sp. cb2023]|nr:hypothetical protein QZH41_000240 [Actinostola sp. cb2023]